MLRKKLSSLPFALCLAVAVSIVALAGNSNAAKAETNSKASLASVLAAQPSEIKERYAARHPLETLTFCEVQKGDTIVETLPGRGWYSGILYPYAGETGRLIGAQYPRGIFERIGMTEDRIKTITDRNAKWPNTIATESVAKGSKIDSYTMTEMPDSYNGIVDKVLFIRSLHNLSRFNKDGGYLDKSLEETFRSLKPGGIVCVAQHRAPETASDDWANGSNGYLKQSNLIKLFKAAGFQFVGAREINANPKDRPSETDSVWRLPPTLRGHEPDTAQWRENVKIGESDRMTLKFMKPKN